MRNVERTLVDRIVKLYAQGYSVERIVSILNTPKENSASAVAVEGVPLTAGLSFENLPDMTKTTRPRGKAKPAYDLTGYDAQLSAKVYAMYREQGHTSDVISIRLAIPVEVARKYVTLAMGLKSKEALFPD